MSARVSLPYVCTPDGYLEPRVGGNFGKGEAAFEPKTVIDVFRETVRKHGTCNAMALKRATAGSETVPDAWKFWTWNEYYADCRTFAKSLIALDVSAHQVVNILGFNSPEWFIANCGSIFAGCIAAGVYATNSAELCRYQCDHSRSEVVILEDNKQLAKFSTMAQQLPCLKIIVVYNEPAGIDQDLAGRTGKEVCSWDAFMARGRDVPDERVDERFTSLGPGNVSTLIYTSGTTGPPKAVMISHDNVTWTTKVMADSYMDLNHEDRVISYLPLSHIAAQLIDLHVPMVLGCCTYFAMPDDMKKGTLTKTMADVHPTFFFGVPRVWEKIQEKMVQIGRDVGTVLKHLSAWAKKLGAERSRRAQFGNGGGAPCCYGCANALVLSKIKAKLGLDQCKACFTAAAPISVDVLNYFASLDLPVYEVFGQSECTGPHTVSAPGQWRIGYCGRPLFGTESRIDPKNGELQYRGRHIFMGYMYNEPDTKKTIDADGFLSSGDVAAFDDNDMPNRIPKGFSGFMKITGRIKELIITAGGENIPPVIIEDTMKAANVALSNVMVIGDRRKYLSMLVSLKVNPDKNTGLPTDELAADSLFIGKEIGSTATTYSQAKEDPLWNKFVFDMAKKANGKSISDAQKVQKFKWLPVDFSEKEGDLTPTLKLKRSKVAEKYAALIDSIYADDKE